VTIVRVRFKVRVRVRVRVRFRVANCCIQTAGEGDKMRINHVIKTDQWRGAPQIRPAPHFVVSPESMLPAYPQYRSQAQVNWKACGRKGILRKNLGHVLHYIRADAACLPAGKQVWRTCSWGLYVAKWRSATKPKASTKSRIAYIKRS